MLTALASRRSGALPSTAEIAFLGARYVRCLQDLADPDPSFRTPRSACQPGA